MVKKHKPLQIKSAFGIILFRRENGTWKLKGTANFKKKGHGATLQPRFTTILIREGGHHNNGMRNNLILLTDCSCVHHSLLSKVWFDYLPPAESRGIQRTCSDTNR